MYKELIGDRLEVNVLKRAEISGRLKEIPLHIDDLDGLPCELPSSS